MQERGSSWWRAPESVPWGGTFHGHDGFREFVDRLFGQPAEFRREVGEYLDAGSRVVTLLRQRVGPTEVVENCEQ